MKPAMYDLFAENEDSESLRALPEVDRKLLLQLHQRSRGLDPAILETCLCDAQMSFASASTLHRGYFCPSPVRELVVENEQRGTLVQSAPEDGFVFYRDAQGRLLGCREYHKGKPERTEYIFREHNAVYGFSYLPDQTLCGIAAEFYAQGKLTRYVQMSAGPEGKQCWVEDYHYDDLGLKSCEHCFIGPDADLVRKWRYFFEREDGMLTGYYAAREGCPFPTDEQGNCIAHEITVERKA